MLKKIIKSGSINEFVEIIQKIPNQSLLEMEMIAFTISLDIPLSNYLTKHYADILRFSYISFSENVDKSITGFSDVWKKHYPSYSSEYFLALLISLRPLFQPSNMNKLPDLLNSAARLLETSGEYSVREIIENIIEFVHKEKGTDSSSKTNHLEIILKAEDATQVKQIFEKLAFIRVYGQQNSDIERDIEVLESLTTPEEYIETIRNITLKAFRDLFVLKDEISDKQLELFFENWDRKYEPLVRLGIRYKTQDKKTLASAEYSNGSEFIGRFDRFRDTVVAEIKGDFLNYRYGSTVPGLLNHLYQVWQENRYEEYTNIPLDENSSGIASVIKELIVNSINEDHFIAFKDQESVCKSIYTSILHSLTNDIQSKSENGDVNKLRELVGKCLNPNSIGDEHCIELRKILNLSEDKLRSREFLKLLSSCVSVAEDILKLYNLTSQKISTGSIDTNTRIDKVVERLKAKIKSHGNDLLLNDISTIEASLKSLEIKGFIQRLVIEESDSLQDMIWIGDIFPDAKNCQSSMVEDDGFEMLDRFVVNPARKLCVIRIEQEDMLYSVNLIYNLFVQNGNLYIALENIYVDPKFAGTTPKFFNMIKSFLENKAKDMGAKLVSTNVLGLELANIPTGYYDGFGKVNDESDTRMLFPLDI